MSHLNIAAKSITEIMTIVDEAKDKLTSEQYRNLTNLLARAKIEVDKAKTARYKAKDMYFKVFEEANINKTTVKALQQYIFNKQEFCSCCINGGDNSDSDEESEND